MLTMLEWGHARNIFSEDINEFDDEDHMDELGEFTFQVNEVCFHGDYKSFLISQDDEDSHNPMFVHFTPSEMTWNEAKKFHGRPNRPEIKDARNNRRSTKERHFKDKKDKINIMVSHLQQHHPQRGDHDIDKCKLLRKEDSTSDFTV